MNKSEFLVRPFAGRRKRPLGSRPDSRLSEQARQLFCAAAVLAGVLTLGETAGGQDLGITVSPSGLVLKEGKPYRSIGGNDPFDTYEFFDHDNTAYLQSFADMKDSGMDFVRLTARGWFASEKLGTLYFTDKAAYFQKMDQVVAAAEQNGVGISFGLTWWINCMSDYFGEPMLASSIPGSKTYEGMKNLAADFAERYKNNPAVLCYSETVELNLSTDQPNSGQSVNERWTIEAVQAVLANVSGAIRSKDTQRCIHSGSGDAPGNQFHRTHYCNWSPDTPSQYALALADANPDTVNTLSTHYYPDTVTGLGDQWDVYNALSRQLRKPVYAEEFGNGDGNKPATVRAANFNAALSGLIRNRVPLMNLWYTGAPQNPGDENPVPRGAGAFMWNAIAQANAQYRYGPWKSLSAASGEWNSVGNWGTNAVPSTGDDVYVPTDSTSRMLSISNTTAYARNLAVGTASTNDLAATLDISGTGQLVLGQNADLTFATTSDCITPLTVTVTNAHGQFLDVSGRSAILLARQSAGETKPALVANAVSAYQMRTGDRANISAATGQLNLFDGLHIGRQSASGSSATVYQSGGIVRAGLDANVTGSTPSGVAFAAPADGGTFSPKVVLTGGTLAASRIGLSYAGAAHASGMAVTLNAVVDWQEGALSTLDGASMTIDSALDARNTQSLALQLNGTGTHAFKVADANQSLTVNTLATISGSGNLTKSGPGKLLLLGASAKYSYTGTTTVNDGILQVKNQSALPGWNTASKVFVSARSSSTNDGTVTAGTLALNVGGTGEWTTGNLGTILGGSRITFGAGSALGIDTGNAAGTVTLTAQITGGKGLTKLGTGTLTLNPSANNTFTGLTTVVAGMLQLGATGNTILPAASGLEVRGGTLDMGGKTVTFSGFYSALTDNPRNPPLPWLTQPSRVTFAGGVVQNGTLVNNTYSSAFDGIYDAQSGTVSANLAGTVWLWKTTSGTLTLNGDNSYAGGTRISKGTLILGHANALGTTGDIVFMNGTLKYATGVTADLSARFQNSFSAICIDCNGQTVTFASPIAASNRSGLKKTGAGTLILAAANSYTGGTWIAEGTLRTDVAGALPGASVNDLTFAPGGLLDLNGTSQTIGNLYSMVTGSVVNNKSGTQATLSVSGVKASQFNGVLSDHATGTGTLELSQTGTGKLTLTGTNTFTGPTTVSAGSLQLSSASGPALCGPITTAGGAWLLATADNQFGPNSTLNLSGEIVLQNTRQTVAGLTGGGFIQNDSLYSGAGLVTNGTATLTVNNGGENTFSGLLRDNALGNGKLALTKTGSGALILNSNNTFTGDTTVNCGTLLVNGTLLTTAGVTVNRGAVLSGTGAVARVTVASGGTLAPGLTVAPGALRTGNLTVEAGGALTLRLGAANDAVKVTGDLVLNGTISLVSNGGAVNSGTPLFTYSGSFSGTPTLVAPTGYAAALDTTESGVLRVVLTATLPFSETFEDVPTGMAYVLGSVDGQRGWLAEPAAGATVQTNRAYAGQKSAALLPDTLLRHTFTNGGAIVWCDFFIQAERVPEDSLLPLEQECSVAFHLDSAGRVVMQSGVAWRTCETFTTASNEWVRFTAKLDYAARKWDLYASRAASGGGAERLGQGLDFVAGSANAKLREFRLTTDGGETAYLDNLSVTDASVSGRPGHVDFGTRLLMQ